MRSLGRVSSQDAETLLQGLRANVPKRVAAVIKFVMKGKGNRRVVTFGIDKGNVAQLIEGRPIVVKGEDVGIEGVDIAIVYGTTLQDIVDDYRRAGVNIPPVNLK